MAFKKYRLKGTVEAQQLDRTIRVVDTEYVKGDYMIVNADNSVGYIKQETFDNTYEPFRQRQSRAKKTRKKAAAASGGNGEATT